MILKLATVELQRDSVETYLHKPKLPIVVLLDNVRSAQNIGSIFRTCDAFAIEQIVLTGICATPPNKEILKTALGSTESVKWKYEADALTAVGNWKKKGYKIVAIEQTKPSTFLNQYQVEQSEKLLLVLGNEVEGVHSGIIQLADRCLEIPQFGTKHSLNVSVSAGIVLWHICAQLHENK
jgi:23S rRNA (guanosine2251-2'-O)-methyltransferase